MSAKMKWFAIITSICMILVLLGGALVTKTDSGMGCGKSWPLCNGEWIPSNINTELIIELTHRLVSGIGGILVLILSIWAWKSIGYIRETKFLAFLSIFFLLLQALIGAAAVIWGQSDFVLALHFGISLISFAAVFLLTLLILEVDRKFQSESININKKMKTHILGVTIYSYIVIYTGALVRHTNASLVCPDWPLCINSQPKFPENIFEWIQMGHRVAAGIIILWIARITFIAIKEYRHQKIMYRGWIITLILVTMQAITGAFTVLLKLNIYITLTHAFFVTCLFGMLSYFLLLTFRSEKIIR